MVELFYSLLEVIAGRITIKNISFVYTATLQSQWEMTDLHHFYASLLRIQRWKAILNYATCFYYVYVGISARTYSTWVLHFLQPLLVWVSLWEVTQSMRK